MAFAGCNADELLIESFNEMFNGSDDSDMPESVTMEEINEAGSISPPPAKMPFVFFLVNEPKPDEPDAIDESSRKPAVVVLDPVVAGNPGNGAIGWLTPTTLPKSSCDAIFFLFKFDDGLFFFLEWEERRRINWAIDGFESLIQYSHFE